MLSGAWMAQLVGHVTLGLSVLSLNPMLGVEIIFKKKKKVACSMGLRLLLIFDSYKGIALNMLG